ncbi:MAG: hypothetical protein ACQXXF_07435, partial [Thermoplasmatota archaeon]
MIFSECKKRGNCFKASFSFVLPFFIFLTLFIFSAQHSLAIPQTSNPQLSITVKFDESVNVTNATLINTDTTTYFNLQLKENINNQTFVYIPTLNLTDGLYNFTIFYSDFKIQGLNGYKTYLFRVNFSIPKKPVNIIINTVNELEVGESENYLIEANYDDGSSLTITGNNELENYLTVSSNNTTVLQVSKNPAKITGIYPGVAEIRAEYLQVNGAKTITVKEPPFIKMLTPWNNGTHAYASSDVFDILIYTFRNAECKW